MIPRYTVTRSARVEGTADAHGNATVSWSTPTSVGVFGWAPPSADREPFEANRSLVVRDLDLYAPAGTGGVPGDRWVVDGVGFVQVGHPEDFTRGPWGWAAGVRINLKRAEG